MARRELAAVIESRFRVRIREHQNASWAKRVRLTEESPKSRTTDRRFDRMLSTVAQNRVEPRRPGSALDLLGGLRVRGRPPFAPENSP